MIQSAFADHSRVRPPLRSWALVAIPVLVVGFVYYGILGNPAIVLGTSIAVSVVIAYLVRKNQVVLVLFFFAVTYLVAVFPWYAYGIPFSVYLRWSFNRYFSVTLSFFLIFLAFVVVGLRRPIGKYIIRIPIRHSPVFFWVALIAALAMVTLTLRGTDLFQRGGYAGKGSFHSSLFEYSFILIMIAYRYSKKGLERIAIAFTLGYIVVRTLLYGGRIEAVEAILIGFVFFGVNRMKTLPLLVITVLGFLLISLFGKFRQHPGEALSLLLVTHHTGRAVPIESNQGDVFYTSNVYINAYLQHLLATGFSFKSFFSFVASIFLPSSLIPQIGIPSDYFKQYGQYGGGGLIFAYGFIWFNLLGVCFSGWLVGLIFRKTSESRGLYASVFLTLAVGTFPRWFAYSPITLLKLCTWGIAAVFIVEQIHKAFVRSRSS